MPEPSRRRRTRPARVQTPVIRARVGTSDGLLVNISATGALVRAPKPQRVGTQSRLVFELEHRSVEFTAQVMRCQPVPVSLDGAMLQRPEYHLGVMFTRTSAEALQAVTDLCGGMLGVEDIPNRVLVIADDAQVGERVRRTVSEGGGMVRTIAPSAAVEAARELQPDAIIVAPRAGGESSGWWTAIESLAADPVASAIPLIVIADPATMSADRQHYLAQRRAHVLRLTASTDEFLAALDRVASGRTDAPSA